MNINEAKNALIVAQRNLIYLFDNPVKLTFLSGNEYNDWKGRIQEERKKIIGLEAIISNIEYPKDSDIKEPTNIEDIRESLRNHIEAAKELNKALQDGTWKAEEILKKYP